MGLALAAPTPRGLFATASVELYPRLADHPPLDVPGTYRRIVISRRDRYPEWDEMRDFVRECGIFDRTSDVFMLIPPDAEYVNIHKNAFHWWQRDTSLWGVQQLGAARSGLVLS